MSVPIIRRLHGRYRAHAMTLEGETLRPLRPLRETNHNPNKVGSVNRETPPPHRHSMPGACLPRRRKREVEVGSAPSAFQSGASALQENFTFICTIADCSGSFQWVRDRKTAMRGGKYIIIFRKNCAIITTTP